MPQRSQSSSSGNALQFPIFHEWVKFWGQLKFSKKFKSKSKENRIRSIEESPWQLFLLKSMLYAVIEAFGITPTLGRNIRARPRS